MSDLNGVEPTSFARLDALANRGKRRSHNGDGPGFDALVAEATSRMMKGLTTGKVSYDTRPKGALGMAAQGAIPTSIPLPASADEAESAVDTATGATSETAAANRTATATGTATATSTATATGNERAVDAATPAVAGATAASGVGSAAETAALSAVDKSITKAKASAAGELVLRAALDQVGAAYEADGVSPDTGFDDAGLVRYAYRAVGVEMPAGGSGQATMGVAIESVADALPGDVIAFGQPTDHVAIYAGSENIVHSPSADEAVRVEGIERPVESIRRIVTPGTGPVTKIEFTPGEMERQYQPLFDAAGGEWNVEPALLAAIAQTESNFNPVAVSPAGAQGLMQFMPATAREMNVDPWDPASAIDGAARYMRTSLDQFEEPELAIASYNAGRGAVSRHGGIPPFTETQNYVRKVVDAWRSRS